MTLENRLTGRILQQGSRYGAADLGGSEKINIEYVYQELTNLPGDYQLPATRQKPWGTGHAVLVAEEAIREPAQAVAVNFEVKFLRA